MRIRNQTTLAFQFFQIRNYLFSI